MAGCLGDLAGKLLEKRLIHGVKAGEHGIGGEVAHILEPVLDGLAAEDFGLILPLLDDVVERRRGVALGSGAGAASPKRSSMRPLALMEEPTTVPGAAAPDSSVDA